MAASFVSKSPTSISIFKVVLALLLGICEIILLGLYVDSADFGGTAWWAPVVRNSPQLLQFFIAAGTATTAFGILISSGKHHLQVPVVCPNSFVRFVIVNLISYSCFVPLTRVVFNSANSFSFAQQILFACWVVLGLITTSSLAASVFPLKWWLVSALRYRWVLLVGALTGVVAWGAGTLANQIWLSLADATFLLVQLLLSTVYDDLVIEPAEFILGTSRFKVVIAPSCSGYEGLGLVAVFLTVFCWIFRKRLKFPQAWLLFPIGFVVVWLLNVVRIATLISIGTSWSSDVALGGFHSQAGWLVFNFVSLGLVFLGTRVQYFVRGENESEKHRLNVTACFLGPFLASIVVGMAVSVLSEGNFQRDFLPVCRIATSMLLLYVMREGLRNVRWSFTWESIALGVVGYAIWIQTMPAASRVAEVPSTVLSLSLLARLVSYVILTPIIEELAFRGFLLRRVVSEDFANAQLRPLPLTAIAISSLLFGLFHGTYWLPGIIAGIIFAIAFARNGRLGDSIVAHATTNALLAVHATVSGDSAIWS